MGSLGAVMEHPQLGRPGKSLWSRYDSEDAAIKSINPNYEDLSLSKKERKRYRENCALCTTAALLDMRGYDVEAMPRDTTKSASGRDIGWRGAVNVFDFDYNDFKSYIAPGSDRMNPTGMDWHKSIKNPNKFTRSLAKNADLVDKQMQAWGENSAAELIVGWKRGGYHSVVVFSDNGVTKVVDFQDGSKATVHDYMLNDERDTLSPSHMELKRLDNAPIKQNIKDLDKMVRKKERKKK